MKNCGTCTHWRKAEEYLDVGECNAIQKKVAANVHYGWDGGSIQGYETEADFYCSLYQKYCTVRIIMRREVNKNVIRDNRNGEGLYH